MTKKHSTKRALALSVLSLVLCFSMLLGTTYAWFTDSVSSANNIITAGNLDIDLEYAKVVDGVITKWAPVQGEDEIFDPKALWEPGRVEVVYLKVSNLGSLALKYQLGVNVYNEVVGKNMDGEELKLSDHLVFKVVEMPDAFTTYTDREAVAAAAGTEKGLKDYNGKTTALEVGGVDHVALIVYMPETVGNEANYRGNAIPKIELGINLYATQQSAEDDSFGNDYDAGAYLPIVSTAEELQSALENNESVRLGADIVLDGEWKPIGDKDAGVYYTGTLDGAGHTVSGLNVSNGDYVALISAAKNATVKNLTVEGAVTGENAAGIIARVEGNTVIENCVSNVTVAGSTKAGGIVCNVTGADAKIVNCTNNANVSGGNSGIGGIVGYVNNDAYLEIINCANNGNVTSDNNKYAGAAVGYGAKSKGVVAGFTNTGVITGKLDSNNRFLKDGDTVLVGYVHTSGNWIHADAIATANELVDAFANLKAHDVLYIAADIDMTGKTIAPVKGNKGFSMYGNGYTISNLTTTAAALFVDHSGSSAYMFDSVVLENCSVNSASNYGALFVGDGDTSDAITIKNCQVINCDVVSAKYAAAFVAYTAGYNVVTNGPVYSDVIVEDCSVTGGSITGGGSVGAAIGHAGGNDDTTTTVTNLTVKDVAINGEDAAHTGIVVGTAHIGDTVINNATYDNVTGNINGLFGRFVPNATGTLVIDGAAVLASASNNALKDAVASGDASVYLPVGNYTMPTTNGDVTISGTKDTVISGNDATAKKVTLNGVTVQSTGAAYTGIKHSEEVVYNNVTIVGNMYLYAEKVVFNNCTFDLSNTNDYIWVYGATNVEFNNCTFNTMGKAILVFQDGSKVNQTVKVEGCTFNASAPAYNWDKTIHISAVSIDGAQGGTYNVILNNNTVDSDFNGLWQDKTAAGNITVTVDGAAVLKP